MAPSRRTGGATRRRARLAGPAVAGLLFLGVLGVPGCGALPGPHAGLARLARDTPAAGAYSPSLVASAALAAASSAAADDDHLWQVPQPPQPSQPVADDDALSTPLGVPP